eukprot:gene14122-20797_t
MPVTVNEIGIIVGAACILAVLLGVIAWFLDRHVSKQQQTMGSYRATIQLGGGYSNDILSGQVQMPKGVGLIGGTRPSLISESTEDRGFQNSWGYSQPGAVVAVEDMMLTSPSRSEHELSMSHFELSHESSLRQDLDTAESIAGMNGTELEAIVEE